MNEIEKQTEQTEVVETEVQQVEQPKTYTQDEVDAMMGKRVARERAKIQKQIDREYGGLLEVLEAGTGKKGVAELTDTFKGFYTSKGMKMPEKPQYSDKDIETLATAEAKAIIEAGFEDVVDEVDRLTEIGVENMDAREKARFKVLAEHRQATERKQELEKIGVSEDVINSQAFRDFAGKFVPNTPIAEIYGYYASQHKKEIKNPGSMKSTPAKDTGVKDFYSYEEAKKFTKADFDKNPALYKAVCDSMTKW